jgi:hypothetical protein
LKSRVSIEELFYVVSMTIRVANRLAVLPGLALDVDTISPPIDQHANGVRKDWRVSFSAEGPRAILRIGLPVYRKSPVNIVHRENDPHGSRCVQEDCLHHMNTTPLILRNTALKGVIGTLESPTLLHNTSLSAG